jgi:hypothetical protein
MTNRAKTPVQDEVSTETKLQLVQQERQMWINTREVYTMRYRVMKRLKDEVGMENAQKELEKCETALDELDKIFVELQKSTKPQQTENHE